MKGSNRLIEKVYTISLLVSNKPGVLLRIALIFSRRGFNIESLVVSSVLDGRFSRMTITTCGDFKVLEEIIKQAQKLVDVIHVYECSDADIVDKELSLIKVRVDKKDRDSVFNLIDHFYAKVVDLNSTMLIVMIVDSSDKITSFVKMLSEFQIIEVVRTGSVVMERGENPLLRNTSL